MIAAAAEAPARLRRRSRSGPSRRPSRSMAVTSKVSMPAAASAAMASAAGSAGSALAPALAEREAVPDVDGRDEPVGAVTGDQRRGEGRIAEQGRADHGPGGPGPERARDRLGGPEPAADLDLHPAVDLGDDARRPGPAGEAPPPVRRRGPRRAASPRPRPRTRGRRRPDRPRRPSPGRSRPGAGGPRDPRAGRSRAAARNGTPGSSDTYWRVTTLLRYHAATDDRPARRRPPAEGRARPWPTTGGRRTPRR